MADGALVIGVRVHNPFFMIFKATASTIIPVFFGMCIPFVIIVKACSTVASINPLVMAYGIMVYPIVAKGGGTGFLLSAGLTGLGTSLRAGGGGLLPGVAKGIHSAAIRRAAGASAGFSSRFRTGRRLSLCPGTPAMGVRRVRRGRLRGLRLGRLRLRRLGLRGLRLGRLGLGRLWLGGLGLRRLRLGGLGLRSPRLRGLFGIRFSAFVSALAHSGVSSFTGLIISGVFAGSNLGFRSCGSRMGRFGRRTLLRSLPRIGSSNSCTTHSGRVTTEEHGSEKDQQKNKNDVLLHNIYLLRYSFYIFRPIRRGTDSSTPLRFAQNDRRGSRCISRAGNGGRQSETWASAADLHTCHSERSEESASPVLFYSFSNSNLRIPQFFLRSSFSFSAPPQGGTDSSTPLRFAQNDRRGSRCISRAGNGGRQSAVPTDRFLPLPSSLFPLTS